MEGTGKLVRDRIPELIRADGGEPRTRTAHGEEFPALLRLKLLDVVQDYLDSEQPDELVDVIEVVHALARLKGMTPERLEKLRSEKQAERGGFGDQTVLITDPDEPTPDEAPPGPAHGTAPARGAAPADASASRPARGTAPDGAPPNGAAPADAPPAGTAARRTPADQDSEAPTVENPVPPEPPRPRPARVVS